MVNLEYKDLSKDTKKYFNMAMDIFSSIIESDISKDVRGIVGREFYHFTLLDKRILSLFLAGLLVDGDLKDIFSNYSDIKTSDLLKFMNLSEEEIKHLNDSEYEEFYKKNFLLDLITLFQEKETFYKINSITPAIIMSCLSGVKVCSSDILNYYGNEYNLSIHWFHEHPIFSAVQNYAFLDGSLEKKEVNSSKTSNKFLSSFLGMPLEATKESKSSKKQKSLLFDNGKIDDIIWELLVELKKKFIGQEGATEDLFYNIVNNQLLASMEHIPDGQRSLIFLDGPTGTGKTAIARDITDKLGIPFTSTSITNYSSTGYVGGDISDVLKELYKKADGDLEKAERGIVVFDEFDKIAFSRSGGLEMKQAVQQQLLDFLGGGKYTIRVGESIFDRSDIEFDTSKITFICLGALTELRANKTGKKAGIGFGEMNTPTQTIEYSITPQDLMNIGLERELVGRFNTYLHTIDYSKDDLEKILRESTISPFIGFKTWIESRGKKLEIDENVYGIIAEQAYELNIGARSLQTVMNNIRTAFLSEVLRGNLSTITLDSDTVIRLSGQAITRKGRG